LAYLPKIIAGIDDHGSVRIEVDIIGTHATRNYGAVLDSGFTGDVVLPLSMAVSIGLTTAGVAQVELADGSTMDVELFLCRVKIGDIEQEASVMIMGNDVLIGTGLMTPFDVCFRVGNAEAAIEPNPVYADFVGVLRRLTGGV